MSAGSLTVQTCTCSPCSCARHDRAPVHHRDPPLALGDLEAVARARATAAPSPAPQPGAEQEPHHDAGAGRRGHGPGEPVERRAAPCPGERADQHPVVRGLPLDHRDRRGDRRARLHVDVDPQVRPGVQHLGEGGDRLAAADPRLAHLRPRQLGDPPGAVGDPVQRRVVEGDRHPVGGGVDVGLDVASSRGRRPPGRRPSSSPARRGRSRGARARSASGRPGSPPSSPRSARARWRRQSRRPAPPAYTAARAATA